MNTIKSELKLGLSIVQNKKALLTIVKNNVSRCFAQGGEKAVAEYLTERKTTWYQPLRTISSKHTVEDIEQAIIEITGDIDFSLDKDTWENELSGEMHELVTQAFKMDAKTVENLWNNDYCRIAKETVLSATDGKFTLAWEAKSKAFVVAKPKQKAEKPKAEKPKAETQLDATAIQSALTKRELKGQKDTEKRMLSNLDTTLAGLVDKHGFKAVLESLEKLQKAAKKAA